MEDEDDYKVLPDDYEIYDGDIDMDTSYWNDPRADYAYDPMRGK